VATPFVQGRLREETLSVAVHTECACCALPIDLEIDSDLGCRVLSDGASPLLTVPVVDVRRLEAPNIIDDF
jgi:hypothetical protein